MIVRLAPLPFRQNFPEESSREQLQTPQNLTRPKPTRLTEPSATGRHPPGDRAVSMRSKRISRGGSRTHTPLRAGDFKSPASGWRPHTPILG